MSRRQRTSGCERKENTQHENASTQNAPGGGHKETKTEPQNKDMSLNNMFDPPVENEPIELTASPEQRVLNASEENLRHFNNRAQAACRAHDETASQGSATDPAKAARRQNKLDKALRAHDKAEASQDNFAQALQGMRTPRSPLQGSTNSNGPQGQDSPQDPSTNVPQAQNMSGATVPTTGPTTPARQTTVRTSNVTSGGGSGPPGGRSGPPNGGGGRSNPSGGGGGGGGSDPPPPSGPGNNLQSTSTRIDAKKPNMGGLTDGCCRKEAWLVEC